VGSDEYQLRVPIEPGEDGMVGRGCPDDGCVPGYFKVRPGTGITSPQETVHCPYCYWADRPSSFTTREQREHAVALVEAEAVDGMNRMLTQALGLGPSGKRVLGGGSFSIEMSMTPARTRRPGRLLEEELRRDLVCPHCSLHQAVFGLATWCSDCGTDIFSVHVSAELAVLRAVMNDVADRRARLGARIAARDIENTLEDLVSVMEAVLKALTKRHLCAKGLSSGEAGRVIENEIRSGYQTLSRARDIFQTQTGAVLGGELPQREFAELSTILEKRHPIAHNLGVVDRKYLLRVRTGELEGREVRVEFAELASAIDSLEVLLTDAWRQLFPPRSESDDSY
jgi:uncharacterized protein YoaH (UPF0181 family)